MMRSQGGEGVGDMKRQWPGVCNDNACEPCAKNRTF